MLVLCNTRHVQSLNYKPSNVGSVGMDSTHILFHKDLGSNALADLRTLIVGNM